METFLDHLLAALRSLVLITCEMGIDGKKLKLKVELI